MFTHLHNHSQYSFLDGIPLIDQLLDRVIELDQNAVAVTDHGNVSSHLELQKVAAEKEVKPIFGMEGYFCDDRRVKVGKKGEKYEHITILAKDQVGLRNLWSLSSRAWKEGMHYDPRADWALFKEYHEGLIVTSGCMSGAVAALFVEGSDKYDEEAGRARLGRFLDLFGEDYYVELHTFQDPKQFQLNARMVELATEMGIKVVAVSDSHYLRPEDWKSHEILTAAQMGKSYDDPTRFQYGPGQLHVMSEEEVREKLSYLGEAVVSEGVKSTQEITEQCNVKIEKASRSLPVFFDNAKKDKKELTLLAWAGFADRMKAMGIESGTEAWLEREKRLDYEINLINEKGFAGYFLTVREIVAWAKEQGILVGPSRGSVGGSLLAYVLRITELDPVRHGIIFGRFLDPGRESLPDIDLDFPKAVKGVSDGKDRQTVREYLESKYHVVTIGTLSKMAPKKALRDLARVLRISMFESDRMAKIVGQVKDLGVSRFEVSWDQIMEQVGPDLKPWIDKYPELFKLIMEFKDHVRHPGAHASGVVASKEELLGRLPLWYSTKNDDIRTQFDMYGVEEQGFVKIDMLGIRTLTTLQRAWQLCRKRYETDVFGQPWRSTSPEWFYSWEEDWTRYYEDESVYDALATGKNIGIFQLETSSFREHIKRFRPRSVADIATLISINRPGITRAVDKQTELNLLELYLRKREGTMPAEFKHPALEPVLGLTLGQFVFQEQIMQGTEALAGYDLIEQDHIRVILGKMKRKEMQEEKPKFIERCEANGVPATVAEWIWDDMETFGAYGFNAAHGFGYGILSYWCAFMKHHYPREFMTALFQTNEKKAVIYARECRRMGIPVLGPDINESLSSFTLTEGGVIRYGLHRVKWVGDAANVVEELRPFSTLDDLFSRAPKSQVSKRAMVPLIRVGALNSLVTDELREKHPDYYTDSMIAAHEYFEHRKDWKKMDDQLTGEDGEESSDSSLSFFEAWCEEQRIRNPKDFGLCEEELLGNTVSVDPFEAWIHLMLDEDNFTGIDSMFVGERRILCGIVRQINPTQVKKEGPSKGRAMCQFWVERPLALTETDEDDEEDNTSDEDQQIVCFPKEFDRYGTSIESGAPVFCRVEKLGNDGGLQLRQLIRFDAL